MIDSIWRPRPAIRPSRISSRLSRAEASSISACSNASRRASASSSAVIPWATSWRERCQSVSARLWAASAASTRRCASTSSLGVGSGTISNSGSPARTRSPTSTAQRRTMPEILDLTANLSRGSIWPTATAFSVIEPRSTSISSKPLSDVLRFLRNA